MADSASAPEFKILTQFLRQLSVKNNKMFMAPAAKDSTAGTSPSPGVQKGTQKRASARGAKSGAPSLSSKFPEDKAPQPKESPSAESTSTTVLRKAQQSAQQSAQQDAQKQYESAENRTQISVTIKNVGTLYEVTLIAQVKRVTPHGDIPPWLEIDVQYGALIEFPTKNVSSEQAERALIHSTPQLLFPFVRKQVFDASIMAGFPAVMLDSNEVDKLWNQNRNALQKSARSSWQ